MDFDSKIKTMKSVKAKLKDLEARVPQWQENTPSSLVELRRQVVEVLESADKQKKVAADMQDSLEHHVHRKANLSRATATKLRHKRDRFGNPLVAGSWPKALARHM